jgi:hypothetical protein
MCYAQSILGLKKGQVFAMQSNGPLQASHTGGNWKSLFKPKKATRKFVVLLMEDTEKPVFAISHIVSMSWM